MGLGILVHTIIIVLCERKSVGGEGWQPLHIQSNIKEDVDHRAY